MPSLRAVVLTFAIGAALASPAAAQWKWKGKDGRVQYSDLPPPAGVAEEDILLRPNSARRVSAPAAPASAAASAAAPTGVDPQLEAQRKKTEQEAAAKKKAEDDKVTAARAENCARAKSHMRTLDDGIRIARTNAQGEREILDDKQRADESKRTRDAIASDCK